jgi:hypothetical protein
MRMRISILKTDRHYYVYERWRTDSNVCFYVGKGCGNRAWSFYSRNYQFMRILVELYEKQLTPNVRIYRTNLTSKEALKIERERMAFWARAFVKLSNTTGAYRRNLKRLRRVCSAPSPEALARVQRMFG